MSRIGKEPVTIVDGVTCTVAGQKVTVKGKLGELSYTMHEGITANVEDGILKVACADDDKYGNFHGLARALINNPSTIIADEPTGNLDPAMSLEIMSLLQEINNLGTTMLVVTHAKDLVERFGKRTIVIKDGQLVSDGTDGYYSYENQ